MSDDSASTLPQPDIRPLGDNPPVYVLAAPYIYEWQYHTRSKRIVIPEGFSYDGASVPRWAWTVSGLRPDGLLRAAALVHDWLYVHGGNLPPGSFQYRRGDEWRDVLGHWPRKAADRMFARLLREAGVSKFKRRLAYKAVRMFGRGGW